MDPSTPGFLDVNYYRDILANRGLFTSDQTPSSDPTTAQLVDQFLDDQSLCRRKFARAMVKMGQIGVLTGTAGAIRGDCIIHLF